MKKIAFILALLLAAPISAQERPIAGTTLQTTDTSANSLLVGCAVGSTTCTGGIKAGPVVGSTITSTGSVIGVAGTFSGTVSGVAGTFSGLISSTATGTQIFGGGGTVTNSIIRLNGGSGTGIGAYIQFQRNGTTSALIGDRAGMTASGTSADLALFAETGNAIGFMTNGSTTQKFGINTSGDWLKGSNIMDSTGTPTISGGFSTSPTITGNDYAFTVDIGSSGSSTSGTVAFGRAWTTAPVCVANMATAITDPAITVAVNAHATTTTSVKLSYTSTDAANDPFIRVLCRSY